MIPNVVKRGEVVETTRTAMKKFRKSSYNVRRTVSDGGASSINTCYFLTTSSLNIISLFCVRRCAYVRIYPTAINCSATGLGFAGVLNFR